MGDAAVHANEIWVLAEGVSGRPIDATYELLGKARELAASKVSALALVATCPGASSWDGLFAGCGVSKLYHWDSPELDCFHEEPVAEALANAARTYRPETILGPATARGRSLLPRLAVLLETGLTADCTRLEIDSASGKLLQTRPAFGGNLLATIVNETFPQMSTVRPHVFQRIKAGNRTDGAPVQCIDISPKDAAIKPVKRQLSWTASGNDNASLSDASVVVAVGMGVGSPKGVELATELATKIGGAVAASRSVVDSGWLDYSRQVGQTGLTIHPKTYIACGISGAIQHLVGMQDSEFIVAVNRDPDAPIFSVADVAICGDVHEILPPLIAKL